MGYLEFLKDKLNEELNKNADDTEIIRHLKKEISRVESWEAKTEKEKTVYINK